MFYPLNLFYLHWHKNLIDAMRTKLWLLSDDVQFLLGHGPMSTFGKERQTNPYVGDSAEAITRCSKNVN